jgi:glycosyltransferase involved in cell wall biosynthesis
MSDERSSDYVCAFRGRRDNYQVPVALAEAGKLDQFITDFYATASARSLSVLAPRSLREKLASRFCPAIPKDRVRSLWWSTGIEHLRHAFGVSRRRTYSSIDTRYSLAARDRARNQKANLFLYSPYAWEAFTADYEHHPHKVLFQYHPHSEFERRLLAADVAEYPEVERSFREETGAGLSSEAAGRERDVWKYAHTIICASSFTRETLIAAGAEREICHVVPYGVETPDPRPEQMAGDTFQALFVGSGVQRKGLHHLLRAWKNAKLPPKSRLILVCRNIDSGIAAMIGDNPSIELRQRVAADELASLYAKSSLFVMPSLTEGFGQVFLEALAAGCPVLGTANTCLQDIGGEEDGIFSSEPGNIEQLTAELEGFGTSLGRLVSLRDAAQRCAKRFTWNRFRREIIRSLEREGLPQRATDSTEFSSTK